jgi:hypothetical protein
MNNENTDPNIMPPPSETTLFLYPLRAKLATTAVKQCTYFALYHGKTVFVKGPFSSREDATVSITVSALKRMAAPELHASETVVVEAIVDSLEDCQFGLRLKLRGKPAFFQVTESFLGIELAAIPEVPKTTKKAWLLPVRAVDWDKVTTVRHHVYNKEWEKSVYDTEPILAEAIVKNALFSWVVGAGADLACANFMIKGNECLQVDMDTIDKFNWQFNKTVIAGGRTQAGPQMLRFIKAHWTDTFEPFINLLANCSSDVYAPRAAQLVDLTNLEAILFPALPPFQRKRKIDADNDDDAHDDGEHTAPKKIKIRVKV